MDLNELRSGIDSIDRQLVGLLNERYEIVRQIGKWKAGHGLPVHVPEREKALLDKLSALNTGPMSDAILRAIFREIISGSYQLETEIRNHTEE